MQSVIVEQTVMDVMKSLSVLHHTVLFFYRKPYMQIYTPVQLFHKSPNHPKVVV